MKSFVKLSVAGLTGVVLIKLAASLVFPLMGLVFSLLWVALKLAVLAAVVYFVYSLLRKKTDGDAQPGPDGEIVVEPDDEDADEDDED